MEWLLVWEAYRRLHAYARKHREAVLPDQRDRMTATLPTKPYTEHNETACKRLAAYIDQLGHRPDLELVNQVLWSRWIAMSPGAVWRGPMDGWSGLVWRPITSFIPPEARGGFKVFQRGWEAFEWKELHDPGLAKVRFPLEPDPVPSRGANEVAVQLAALRSLCAANPALSQADFLRFYRPDGEALDSAFSRAEWLPVFYAATAECWDQVDETGLPWIARKVPNWARFLEGLLTVTAERRAVARMLYLLLSPTTQATYLRQLNYLRALFRTAWQRHGFPDKQIVKADTHLQDLLYNAPYPPGTTNLTT